MLFTLTQVDNHLNLCCSRFFPWLIKIFTELCVGVWANLRFANPETQLSLHHACWTRIRSFMLGNGWLGFHFDWTAEIYLIEMQFELSIIKHGRLGWNQDPCCLVPQSTATCPTAERVLPYVAAMKVLKIWHWGTSQDWKNTISH